MSAEKLERQYIADLKGVFEAQGSRLYEGQHTLCLTNHCLHCVLRKLASIQQVETSSNKSAADLQHIAECLSRVQLLKLITDRKTSIPQSLINLDVSLFKSLQSLTLKRIPLNSLSGLQRVREQLCSLVVEKCGLADMEDLVVKCGRDEARPFIWNCLKELDLSANSIRTLGTALQYLPSLEKVSFSSNKLGEVESGANSQPTNHNSIKEQCRLALSGIKYIDSVNWLHLGYNRLTCIPNFGDRARFNLTVLILRNNSLTDLEGIEALDSLKELDISDNLISDFNNLLQLCLLRNLLQLTLTGNPVTFNSKYRMKTAQYLSPSVSANSFVLDYKKLSVAEKKVIPRSPRRQYSSPLQRGSTPLSSSNSLSLTLSNETSNSLEKPPSTATGTNGKQQSPGGGPVLSQEKRGSTNGLHSLESTPTGKKTTDHSSRRTSSLKPPRLITFEEGEENLTSTPLKHGDKIKKNQNLRSQLRTSWLSVSNASDDGSVRAPVLLSEDLVPPPVNPMQADSHTSSDDRTHSNVEYSVVQAQSDSTTTITQLANTNSEEGISTANHQQMHGSSEDTNSHLNNHSDSKPDFITRLTSSDQSSSRVATLVNSHAEDDVIAVKKRKKTKKRIKEGKTENGNNQPQTAPSIDTTDELTVTNRTGNSSTTTTSTSTDQSTGITPDTQPQATTESAIANLVAVEETTNTSNGVTSNGVFDMEETDTHSLEQAPVSKVSANYTGDVFHVALHDSASEDDDGTGASMDRDVWMILTDRFIQEVTLNGDVQDQLDLQCLTLARVKNRRHRRNKCRVLVLQFNYERRDRRKREYMLTSEEDESKLMSMLEPIVQQNTTDVSIATKLECLKCQIVIDWSEALDDPMGSSPLPLTPHSAHSLDPKSWSTQDKICPQCKERFLILQTGSEHSESVKRSLAQPKIELMQENTSRQSYGFKMTDDDSVLDDHAHSDSTHPVKDLLSPGHMNLSMFDTYPDEIPTTGVSDDQDHRLHSSPLPDLGPFNLSMNKTPQKEASSKVGVADDSHSDLDWSDSVMSTPRAREQNQKEFEKGTTSPNLTAVNDSYAGPGSNPFENPLYSEDILEESEKEETLSKLPSKTPLTLPVVNESPSSKSSSWSNFKPDSRSVELDSVSLNKTPQKQQTSNEIRDKVRKTSSTSGSNSPLLARHSPISASVPSDNGFMALFRRTAREKRTSHERTKSQDMQKIPPLPEDMIHGGVSQKDHSTRLLDSPSSAHNKSGSQSSLTSEGRGHHRSNERHSSGEERKASSGSGSGRLRFPVKGNRFKLSGKKSNRSSSEAEDVPTGASGRGSISRNDLLLYKNKDPTYLHSNMVLHLKMNVFTSDSEELQLVLRSTMIEYGVWNEVETFLIISNTTAYLYKVIGPENLEIESWLELTTTLDLSEVVYIEIGVCYQSLRLEFDSPPRCYTFMIGIEESCRKIFDQLSYIVSDAPNNLFKSIRVTQFSLSHLVNPHEVLRNQLLEHYDNEKMTSSGRGDVDSTVEVDESLEVFVLGYKYTHKDSLSKVLVTLVLTDKHLFIGVQNPQWPFPTLGLLPNREDLLPPYSGVIQKDITDVEKLVLYDDHSLRITIKFFEEGITGTEGRRSPLSSQSTWTIILRCSKSLKKFVSCLKTSWSKEFQQDLPIVIR